MKIKDGFVMRNVGGENVVVPTGKACSGFKGMIRLNETAAFLWDFFAAEHTSEEATEALLAAYDADRARAEADVRDFIDVLKENRLCTGAAF